MSGVSWYAPFTRRTRAWASRSRSKSSAVLFRFAWRQIPTRSYWSRSRSPIHIEPEDASQRLRRLKDRDHLGECVGPIDQHSELGRLDAHLAADSLGLHRREQAQIFASRRLDGRFLAVVLAEVVHERVEPASVRLFRDPNRVGHRLPSDPLPGEPGDEPHRSARTPPPAQIGSEPPLRTGHTGCWQAMQNWTNSGFRRPQLRQRTRTSDACSARPRAVLATLPAPVTTPTRRKIHQRRTSHPPMPARTPPMTNSMTAPKNDWKNAVTENDALVAWPIVPVRKLRNP